MDAHRAFSGFDPTEADTDRIIFPRVCYGTTRHTIDIPNLGTIIPNLGII